MNQHKLLAFSETMDRYGQVIVFLDPRRPNVTVPEYLTHQCALALSFRWAHYSPDFSVDEWGIREILTFSGGHFACEVPWSAVYMLGSGANLSLWPGSFTPEAHQALFGSVIQYSSESEPPEPEPEPKNSCYLKLVK